MEQETLRFAVDMMLGKLARWLSFLGYDVRYFQQIEDEELAGVAQREGRIILTRDRHLADLVKEQAFLVRSTELWEQLREVTQQFPVDFKQRALSRCAMCNGEIEEVDKQEVNELLPPLVQRSVEAIFRCRGCGKLYWEATHVREIKRRLREHLGIELDEEPDREVE